MFIIHDSQSERDKEKREINRSNHRLTKHLYKEDDNDSCGDLFCHLKHIQTKMQISVFIIYLVEMDMVNHIN